jgi:hypothetical protein
MIFRDQFFPGAFFARVTSQICRVPAGQKLVLVAKVAEIASLNEFSSVTGPFFPWHDHC